MKQTLCGHGGWAVRRWRPAWVAVMASLALALGTGCSSTKTQQPGAAGTQGAGLGEQGIGGNKSSLMQFQKGTLGAGTSGPLQDIHFAFNDYTIQPQDGEILRSNARWLQNNSNSHVQIEGHCDERGSEEYNIALGAKRAQAGKDYLETLGINGGRISTISYGKELPLCTEHTGSCWAQNRRDHFVISQ